MASRCVHSDDDEFLQIKGTEVTFSGFVAASPEERTASGAEAVMADPIGIWLG